MKKQEFQYMSKLLYGLFKEAKQPKIYERLWNPMNYAIIGGIGVVINYLVWLLLQPMFVWWVTNALAILIAWTWNWSNSVGPLGFLWGFKEKGEKPPK